MKHKAKLLYHRHQLCLLVAYSSRYQLIERLQDKVNKRSCLTRLLLPRELSGLLVVVNVTPEEFLETIRVNNLALHLLTVLIVLSRVLSGIMSAHLCVFLSKRPQTEARTEDGGCEHHVIIHWTYLFLTVREETIGALLVKLELEGLDY